MKRAHSTDAYLTVTIAALAFLLSYTKLVDLALRAGYGAYAAHVWPLIVDGITIVATRGVLRLTGSRRYAWTLLAAGTGVSMTAAVGSQVLPPGPLPPLAAAAVSVVPPLCLLVAPHLAVQLARDAQSRPGRDVDTTPDTMPAEAAAPTVEPEVAVETPKDRRARALELLATTTMSFRAVAKEVGVTDTSVRRWARAGQEVTQNRPDGMIRA
ncbi:MULTISPECIES: DUF2637 domain-containing protein [Rhodococcus]|uniref:DUF2637 domain-containing protein n=1 Tax=Rhodococcus TaxID=1827 RepID=UPI00143E26F9|nr:MULTISPECIES: DUF2637 domain-containing protein [Rhodococcus]QIX48961.1 DUF2637 domain-containing protein [Rhodococcus sp. DMU1]QRI75988.1 DUF2637 domain-containing protein [Rhodococcus aetherivorans]QSE59399.1 DUF2637 domain-containing protein [Rhodococcus sp. PSBB066]QSE69276.1 DUF2637 domain-containing protein [Rhodococcus sp. PSBB049]